MKKGRCEVLPTFLICGAPKAGTTSLAHYLRRHPDIFVPDGEEIDFFNKYYDRGKKWYTSKFEDWKDESEVGESSVKYMVTKGVEKRIYKMLPNVKLIFVLRDPIERAYSDHNFLKRMGWIRPDISFEEHIHDNVDVSPSGKEIIKRGKYIEHIKRYDRLFNEEKMKFILTCNLNNTANEVLDFLSVGGVEYEVSKTNETEYIKYESMYEYVRSIYQNMGPVRSLASKYNVRSKVRSLFFEKKDKPEMPHKCRNYLQKVYRIPNIRLEKYLGRDLSMWG